MRQFLTARLTKNVIFPVAMLTICGMPFSLYAQDEDPTSLANPVPEVQPQESAPEIDDTEDTLGDDETESEVAAESSAPLSDDDKKLEEIDEAEVSLGDDESEGVDVAGSATPLSDEVEDLKKAALELNRDLLILEEELLFPANSQIVVFLSLDVGHYFKLDSVKVLIDDKLVASHLYTKRQNSALSLGGIQRLYLGNLKTGDHEVTAFFVGMGPDNREYKRGATINIEKTDDPLLLELKVRDSEANMQPEFEFEEWEL